MPLYKLRIYFSGERNRRLLNRKRRIHSPSSSHKVPGSDDARRLNFSRSLCWS
jgi:hypothetical protein